MLHEAYPRQPPLRIDQPECHRVHPGGGTDSLIHAGTLTLMTACPAPIELGVIRALPAPAAAHLAAQLDRLEDDRGQDTAETLAAAVGLERLA